MANRSEKAPCLWVLTNTNIQKKSKKQEFYNSLNEESKQQFDLYSSNLENLHKYNAHKYLAKSPAVHLDLMDASVKGGWDNYYAVIKNFMSK